MSKTLWLLKREIKQNITIIHRRDPGSVCVGGCQWTALLSRRLLVQEKRECGIGILVLSILMAPQRKYSNPSTISQVLLCVWDLVIALIIIILIFIMKQSVLWVLCLVFYYHFFQKLMSHINVKGYMKKPWKIQLMSVTVPN